MPIEIDGVTYFSAADVIEHIGVARQTLWRWRHAGKIPPGRRYRDRHIVFTAAEFQTIRAYAHRLEPLDPGEVDQFGVGHMTQDTCGKSFLLTFLAMK